MSKGAALTRRCVWTVLAVAGLAFSAGAVQPERVRDEQPTGGTITLDAFSEAVELKALISFTAETLGINVTVDESLAGSAAFNAPVEIQRDELLPLIDALLEPRGFTIVPDATGWYTVRRSADIPLTRATDAGTTRIIRTPNVRPSALQNTLTSQMSASNAVRTTYMDDLGVIVMTGPLRTLDAAERLIDDILEQRAQMRFERLPLRYVAAPAARERAIALLSGAAQTGFRGAQPQPNQPQQQAGLGSGGSLDNLADRLRIDQGDNALLFLGMPDEVAEVRSVLELIDVATRLEPRRYQTGAATANIAQIAVSQGLGEVTELDAAGGVGTGSGQLRPQQIQRQLQQQGNAQSNASAGGSRLIIDLERGYLVYYGTAEQQTQLEALIDQFDTQDDVIVVETYKLQHADAQDVADILQGLISNQRPTTQGDSGNFLLPQGQRGRQQDTAPQPQGDGLSDDAFTATQDESFVIADTANNQILIKAPQRQQREFERLIQRVDLRRPQVYIEAQIVIINDSDSSDLSFETQLFEVGGSQFSFTTSFGTLGAGTPPLESRSGIGIGSGFAGAVLNPRQVPLLINALESKNLLRTVARPQLLVDDNEEAEVNTTLIEQTLETTVNNNSTQTSVGTPAEAITGMTITPQISEGGYIRLDYQVTQDSFVGEGTELLPPNETNNLVRSASVTIPSGSTVVIGGLNIDTETRTVLKIPLLGDIPLLGHLFRSTSDGVTKQRLYVFLTPRILSEPTLNDYRLLTAGSLADAGLPSDSPTLMPQMIPVRLPSSLAGVSLEDLLSDSEWRAVREDLESIEEPSVEEPSVEELPIAEPPAEEAPIEEPQAETGDGRPKPVTAPDPLPTDELPPENTGTYGDPERQPGGEG